MTAELTSGVKSSLNKSREFIKFCATQVPLTKISKVRKIFCIDLYFILHSFPTLKPIKQGYMPRPPLLFALR